MTKPKSILTTSTFEEFMQAKTPAEKKEYAEGYHDFVLSEMILAAMEQDDISVRKLAKLGLTQNKK